MGEGGGREGKRWERGKEHVETVVKEALRETWNKFYVGRSCGDQPVQRIALSFSALCAIFFFDRRDFSGSVLFAPFLRPWFRETSNRIQILLQIVYVTHFSYAYNLRRYGYTYVHTHNYMEKHSDTHACKYATAPWELLWIPFFCFCFCLVYNCLPRTVLFRFILWRRLSCPSPWDTWIGMRSSALH